jgi:excisionase family DNA binding protein
MMLTVPEAARRVRRNPETLRRWIREGKLRARKIGTQHVIEERDLEAAVPQETAIRRSKRWREAWKHAFPEPDWAAWVRSSRDRH